jgi:alpha-1,3-rhamnosyltransferase
LVTVLIPSYNHERYVEQAVRSVIEQTYGNIELIVIDDGSRDSTPELLRQMQEQYGFQLLVRPNKGLCATLNEGIGMASGKYIAFLASDDFYLPGRIENAVKAFEPLGANVGAVYCDGYLVDDNNNRVDRFGLRYPRPLAGSTRDNLIVGNWLPALGMTYSLALLKKFMFDERFKIEDYTLYLKMFVEAGYGLHYYEDFGFGYRWHQTNMSKDADLMNAEYKDIEAAFPEVGAFHAFKRRVRQRAGLATLATAPKQQKLLILLALRALQRKTRAYHPGTGALIGFCLLRARRILAERTRGFLYFGFRGLCSGLRIGGKVTLRGRRSNFAFGKDCRILGDLYMVLEDELRPHAAIRFGDKVTVEHNVYLNAHGGTISAGNACHFGVGSVIQGRGGLNIGEGVLFGPMTRIFASNHNFQQNDTPVADSGENFKGIVIGNNIWVGAGCTILDGAVLGDSSVYGANSIISGCYEPRTRNLAKGTKAKSLA